MTRAGSLPPERILGIETGGRPHAAIREDASINPAGVAEMRRRFPGLGIVLIESGGDSPASMFSPGSAELTIHVIGVSAGDKIPRIGGPGITRGDLPVINKIAPAPLVGASLRGDGPRRPAGAREAAFGAHKPPRRAGGGGGIGLPRACGGSG